MDDPENLTTTVARPAEGGGLVTVTEIVFTPPAASGTDGTTSTWEIWPSGDTVLVYTATTPGQPASRVVTTLGADGPRTSDNDSTSGGDATTTTRRRTTTTTTTQTAGQMSTGTSQTAGSSSSSNSTASASESATQAPSIDSGNSSGGGIGNGTLAGAIVGSIIGSALLTLLLAFLFFRRRRSPPKAASDDDLTYAAVVADKSNTGFSLAAIDPQPADDETVRRRILTLIDHAGLHVDNYYTSGTSVTLSPDAIARLNNYDSGYLPGAAATVLGEPQSQRQVITHLLVYKLLQAIRPGGELLPLLFAAQPQIENSSVATDNALFTWRMLSAHLYREGNYNRNAKQTAALTQAADTLAVDFTSAFAPYALSSFSETDRITHFRDLAAAATELGVWLFAQPCTFEVVWGTGQGEISTVPRVLKTCDEQGSRLVTAQVLVEGERVGFRR
ncbi:hypothetical protein BJY00DRAFT_282288 [Aspergillus carlsbadensis]|nr:hypothetical protein BJY00DRAFT_282288 [Aspergillus carlsbadensis]